tara:strand:- start:19447 stop:19701 length:255 start_codon:yes stop_codon:yes gene_type:complete
MMTPKSEARAFRIWQFAEPLGWNCTLQEASAAINVPPNHVARIVKTKGWQTRFRANPRNPSSAGISDESDFQDHPSSIENLGRF